jgi:hypothetical protein
MTHELRKEGTSPHLSMLRVMLLGNDLENIWAGIRTFSGWRSMPRVEIVAGVNI